jgi:chromosome segregation ATPase
MKKNNIKSVQNFLLEVRRAKLKAIKHGERFNQKRFVKPLEHGNDLVAAAVKCKLYDPRTTISEAFVKKVLEVARDKKAAQRERRNAKKKEQFEKLVKKAEAIDKYEKQLTTNRENIESLKRMHTACRKVSEERRNVSAKLREDIDILKEQYNKVDKLSMDRVNYIQKLKKELDAKNKYITSLENTVAENKTYIEVITGKNVSLNGAIKSLKKKYADALERSVKCNSELADIKDFWLCRILKC